MKIGEIQAPKYWFLVILGELLNLSDSLLNRNSVSFSKSCLKNKITNKMYQTP